jgi:hypothetical protein
LRKKWFLICKVYIYGQFPSFSAGWNISNEEFFDKLKGTISLLKLRSSYGVVGNAEIGDYATLAS